MQHILVSFLRETLHTYSPVATYGYTKLLFPSERWRARRWPPPRCTRRSGGVVGSGARHPRPRRQHGVARRSGARERPWCSELRAHAAAAATPRSVLFLSYRTAGPIQLPTARGGAIPHARWGRRAPSAGLLGNWATRPCRTSPFQAAGVTSPSTIASASDASSARVTPPPRQPVQANPPPASAASAGGQAFD
ncbi:hypothetical protein BS78_03G144600 [Paspalum vaginatum]|nr:hypothetical protein BS78_03G144600 [Paspalum vaginatum]